MTELQEKKCLELLAKHQKMCSKTALYGSHKYCSFIVYENKKNVEDNNITIIEQEIYNLTDDMIPETSINNKLIEPNGNVLFLDDFMDETEIVTYLNQLTKIEFNG